jgi:hypothetical protein
MGIDDGHAVAGGNVSRKHIPQERTFPGTRATEDRKMTAASGWHNVNRPAVMEGIFTAADEDGVKVHD